MHRRRSRSQNDGRVEWWDTAGPIPPSALSILAITSFKKLYLVAIWP